MSRKTPVLVALGVALLLSLQPRRATPAPLRAPQVPVLTNRLQSYFDGLGESIDVETDQLAAQSEPLWTVFSSLTVTIAVTLRGDFAGVDSIGVYSPGVASPSLMRVFPAESRAGWFAVLSFDPSPARLMVTLFDSNLSLQGTTTYPGVAATNFGFYMQGPRGTFFMQDARNPNAAPQMLLFGGTGPDTGSWWLCWEGQPVGAGSDQDYFDAVLLEQCITCAPDPVRTSTWGAVKQRYR
jgi:hypothetical protein